LAPTLLSVIDAPASSAMQGRDISPLWSGRQAPARPVLCELLVENRNLRALRTNEWKVMLDQPRQTAFYFTLTSDADEQHPATKMTESFRAALKQLRDERDKSIEFGRRLDRGVDAIEIDEEMEKRLKALGYIKDED